jgi:signal transduction histidine kinase
MPGIRNFPFLGLWRRMFNRIWKKFTLALLIVAFIPIGYFGYRDLQDARSSVPDQALKTIFLNSVTRAKDIERTFLNAHSDINYLRSNLVMEFYLDLSRQDSGASSYWRSLMEREFSLFLAAKKGYSRIGLLDEYGNEVAVLFKSGAGKIIALKEHEKHNRLTSPYYVGAATLDRYGIAATPMRSSVEPGMNLNTITLIRYATKVFDSMGEARGVLFIDLNGSEIFSSLSLTSFQRSRQAAMVTMKGNYLYNPYFKPSTGIPRRSDFLNLESEFPYTVVAQILSGRRGVISDDPDSLFAYSPIYPQVGNHQLFYVVFDRYSKEHFIARLNKIKKKYLIGAVFAFLLCITIAVVVSHALTRNLGKLGEGVENIRKQRLDHRLEIRSGDEIESLAKAYNMMAAALQDYSESLEKKVEERSRHIKKVERKLMQAEKLAAIGFLAAGVAHEINNPVSIIVTRLEIINKSIEKGDTKDLRRDLDVLYNHASRIAQITGNLLAFSRERSDKCEPVDLNMAVEHVMGLIEPPIIKKGIKLNYSLNPDLPPVLANGSGMEQVIYNIVYNAYQATNTGGSISIKTGRYDDGKVELVVSDTGGGIPKDAIEHIFEPFFTTKETGQGSGLGLSISYGIVQDFGGSISVESEPDSGTTFSITLKAALKNRAGGKKELIGSKA